MLSSASTEDFPESRHENLTCLCKIEHVIFQKSQKGSKMTTKMLTNAWNVRTLPINCEIV